jgi:hypothetical protein
MSVYRTDEIYVGVTGDTKPTPAGDGAIYIITDIGQSYVRRRGLWLPTGGPGWRRLDTTDWSATVTGSGETSQVKGGRLRVDAKATPSATAMLATGNSLMWSQGKGYTVLNWSKLIVMRFKFTIDTNTANGITRITLGRSSADGIGNFDDKGIGIRCAALAISGLAHNGSTLDAVSLSTSVTQNTVVVVQIVSDGSGNIRWILDGVSKGTSTGGPTGDSTAGHDIVQIETDNGGDSADHEMHVSDFWVFVDQ